MKKKPSSRTQRAVAASRSRGRRASAATSSSTDAKTRSPAARKNTAKTEATTGASAEAAPFAVRPVHQLLFDFVAIPCPPLNEGARLDRVEITKGLARIEAWTKWKRCVVETTELSDRDTRALSASLVRLNAVLSNLRTDDRVHGDVDVRMAIVEAFVDAADSYQAAATPPNPFAEQIELLQARIDARETPQLVRAKMRQRLAEIAEQVRLSDLENHGNHHLRLAYTFGLQLAAEIAPTVAKRLADKAPRVIQALREYQSRRRNIAINILNAIISPKTAKDSADAWKVFSRWRKRRRERLPLAPITGL